MGFSTLLAEIADMDEEYAVVPAWLLGAAVDTVVDRKFYLEVKASLERLQEISQAPQEQWEDLLGKSGFDPDTYLGGEENQEEVQEAFDDLLDRISWVLNIDNSV